jgi:hypothetical protein
MDVDVVVPGVIGQSVECFAEKGEIVGEKSRKAKVCPLRADRRIRLGE